MNKWTRITATGVLAAVMAVSTSMVGMDHVSAAEQLQLTIKKGSTVATINGEKQTIIKPYEMNGTTMVQLGLFSRAFGIHAELQEDEMIQLTYGKHIISMTIGSKVAYIDDKKVQLVAAPVMKSNTLMVPLRPLVEGIGGKMKMASGQIVISVTAAETPAGKQAGQHKDKTRVGSSQDQWSIQYPADLVYVEDSLTGAANFMNSDGSYLLQVAVQPDTVSDSVYGQADPEDLLHELIGYAQAAEEVVMDQQVVNGTSGTYAKIISKSSEGYLSETRLYAGNGHLYFVMLVDSEAYNYKDMDEHAALLNSFQMSFNAADDKAEDIGPDADELAEGQEWGNEDYGLQINLPADWQISDDGTEANSESAYSSFNVYNAPAGQTLRDWADHIQSWFTDNFTPDHYRYIRTTDDQVNGHDVVVNEVQYTYDKETWYTEYHVLIQQENYRYYVEYSGKSDDALLGTQFEQFLNSITVDFDTLEENFGQLPLDYYSQDRSKVVTRASSTYGYRLQVPRYWTSPGSNYNASVVNYYNAGGSFTIMIENTSSLDKAITSWKQKMTSDSIYTEMSISDGQQTTVAGVPAYTFTATYESDENRYVGTYTIFTKGKRTFILEDELREANNTSFHQAEIANVQSSFNWTGQ